MLITGERLTATKEVFYIIIEFDKTPIENIYDYVYTLQTVKPDIKTNIIVLRNSQKVPLEIKPVLKE